MPQTTWESLLDIGSIGLVEGIRYDILGASYGDGFYDSSLVGAAQGTRHWTLVYKELHKSALVITDADLVLWTRLNYLYSFFRRHKEGGDLAFIVKSPIDGYDYQARFIEHSLDFTMFKRRIFSTSGIKLTQHRERGVATTEVIVDSENPLQI